MLRVLFQFVGLIGIAVAAVFFIQMDTRPPLSYQRQETNVTSTESGATTTSASSTAYKVQNPTPKPEKVVAKSIQPKKAVEKKTPEKSENTASDKLIYRIEDPYPFAPKSIDTINIEARQSLVNILCQTSAGSLNPISGSGVIIDSKGIILTNAHVAQYILLSSRLELGLSCEIRAGSPARSKWRAAVMYLPEAWVREHAKDIRSPKPMGTGEYDFALLAITGNIDGSAATGPFPALPYDAREAIGFVGDRVVTAAYPAEFAGGIVTQNDLYAASAVSNIVELFTFTDRPIDLLSLGSVILAQSGSSGGAVVNEWGRLIGIITTTSTGATTGERDMRAITLSYVDRALQAQAAKSLSSMLEGDPISKAIAFMTSDAPAMTQLIINEIPRR